MIAAAAATLGSGSAARASLVSVSGFAGFAPVNANAVAAAAGVGYSADGSTFNLTTAANGEAVSGWNPVAQNVTGFNATFTYTSVPGYINGTTTLAADGMTIAFQNATTGSTTALGGTGGSYGYTGISAANAAVYIDNFGGYYNYAGGTNLNYNGGTGSLNAFSGGVNLSTSRPMFVTLNYVGTNLTETVVDPSIHAVYTHTYTGVNLASALGSSTALVGFTGGTGGYNAAQTVGGFKYTATSAFKYAPIVTTGGYNQGMIVPAGASQTTPYTSITATMDTGTAKTGATFYEQGYNAAAPATGLPASGSTFASDAEHTFRMQSYAGNDAMLLNTANPTGTFAVAAPHAYGALSFLMADGNGSGEFAVTLSYANGAASTTLDGNVSPDWFYNGTVAYDANGRVNPNGSTDNVNNGQPNLYEVDLILPDTTDAISGITVTYEGGTGSNLAIYGVSGVAVPEPASVAAVGLVAVGLVGRRRRRRRAA